jgi:outer membrane immunogenic protein
MQTKPFSNRRTARDVSLQFAWKGQHVLPTKDTTCRFAAIFEKLGVAVMVRNFSPSAPTMFLRVAYPDQIGGLGENTMKKFLLGTVGLAALGMVTPASAADLAARPYTKAPPPMVAPVYDWSGFYIGANAGYGWSNRCLDVTAINGLGVVDAEGCRNAGGGVAGGQIGYRWQTASSWVFGLEAQGDWANLRNSNASLFFPGDTWTSKTNALGLFTGQVGYAWNNALWYVKGGAAVANQRWDLFNTVTGIGLAQAERTRWGGTVGTGFEYGFAPNWSVGIEYDYLFRVSDSNTFLTPALAPTFTAITANTRSDVNMITARINYRFGWGSAPIISKY